MWARYPKKIFMRVCVGVSTCLCIFFVWMMVHKCLSTHVGTRDFSVVFIHWFDTKSLVHHFIYHELTPERISRYSSASASPLIKGNGRGNQRCQILWWWCASELIPFCCCSKHFTHWILSRVPRLLLTLLWEVKSSCGQSWSHIL